jgi:hypothetical protein
MPEKSGVADALSAPALAVETDTAAAAPRNFINLAIMPHQPRVSDWDHFTAL